MTFTNSAKNKPLNSKSALLCFSPFIDAFGLLRVGGRLRHSLLHPDEKNPMILPRESYVTHLIVWNAHEKTLHGGTQLVLNDLRQRFWIIRGRQVVRKIIFKYLRCWCLRATPNTQLMGTCQVNACNRAYLFSTRVWTSLVQLISNVQKVDAPDPIKVTSQRLFAYRLESSI